MHNIQLRRQHVQAIIKFLYVHSHKKAAKLCTLYTNEVMNIKDAS